MASASGEINLQEYVQATIDLMESGRTKCPVCDQVRLPARRVTAKEAQLSAHARLLA
jgi:hypothetical protein